MTEKQRKCIEWICDLFEIPYEGGDSKEEACDFINQYYVQAREYQNQINTENFYSIYSYFRCNLNEEEYEETYI